MLQPDCSQKRRGRFHNQDGLGKTAVVESTPEVDPRFDRKNFEVINIQSQRAKREWLHDLHLVGAQNKDIAPP